MAEKKKAKKAGKKTAPKTERGSTAAAGAAGSGSIARRKTGAAKNTPANSPTRKKTAIRSSAAGSSRTRTSSKVSGGRSAADIGTPAYRLHPSGSRRVGNKGPILVITGEHSGDLLAADVVQALQSYGYRDFFGTGGEAMRSVGVELLEDINSMNVVGFVEAVKAYRRLKALAERVKAEALRRSASAIILVDYPGFNLRFAEMLEEADIPIVYLVSPQLWAWKYNRIHKIKKYVDLMLTLFPFEAEMYQREGVRSECIGHPLVSRIPRRLRKEEPLPDAPRGTRITVALMPGSRRSEVSRLLSPMLEAAHLIQSNFSGVRFLLPGADGRLSDMITTELSKYPELKVEYVPGRSLRTLEAADLVLIASGTATLEAAYFKKPMVLMYKVGWLNMFLITLVLRTRFIGIVNILAQRQVSVELLQTEVTPENIYQEAARILSERGYRENMIAEMEQVRKSLGHGNPSLHAARHIDSFLRNSV
ncbi:MAG: lipid-A-disaccharide synthase [Leptospiraceae bacterium]|nr:lipid-A-disaccharide synthase [Leptospiraceae bacterium]